MNLGPERSPIKALPMLVLQVKKSGQDAEHHQTGHDALFVHEGEKPRTATLATQSGNGTPKVNDCAQRVKPEAGTLNHRSLNPHRILMDFQLEGKRALITGSSAGIGYAIAERLALEGASVIVNGRTQQRVDQALAALARSGSRVS